MGRGGCSTKLGSKKEFPSTDAASDCWTKQALVTMFAALFHAVEGTALCVVSPY